mmetsp:Transcript_7801/g.20053  ORF Transcript_7801/g.20053 Transcript_7801/m.20053 type:complete len:200 (+) Transcript_7801:1637-2236(+)
MPPLGCGTRCRSTCCARASTWASARWRAACTRWAAWTASARGSRAWRRSTRARGGGGRRAPCPRRAPPPASRSCTGACTPSAATAAATRCTAAWRCTSPRWTPGCRPRPSPRRAAAPVCGRRLIPFRDLPVHHQPSRVQDVLGAGPCGRHPDHIRFPGIKDRLTLAMSRMYVAAATPPAGGVAQSTRRGGPRHVGRGNQ